MQRRGRARALGEVSIEMVRRAMRATTACAQAAGVNLTFQEQTPVLRACLEEAGFVPDPDVTGMELGTLARQANIESLKNAGSECLMDLGINGW